MIAITTSSSTSVNALADRERHRSEYCAGLTTLYVFKRQEKQIRHGIADRQMPCFHSSGCQQFAKAVCFESLC